MNKHNASAQPSSSDDNTRHSDADSEPDTIEWLRAQSMLAQVKPLAAQFSGQGAQWRHPYAQARPRHAADVASVWFSAYPASIVTRPGASVLATLGDAELWKAFAQIGIKALHTGPIKQAGGLRGRRLTPTIDGHFDRSGLAIDPQFGTVAEVQAMSRNAAANGAIVIDDIIPGHTGKGADFRLAERAVDDYPGLYHMVEIAPADWGLLPPVPAPAHDGEPDVTNLSPQQVDQLQAKGYIVGRLPRVIFYAPGVKETNWSATPVVRGADGVERRWVYLHYFKAGQPTLNWLDPSFAAPRLVLGDALHSLSVLGASMLRLDANGFLGIETNPQGPAWSEGHPLSQTANQLISGLIRKMGGFSFQELNLTIDDIASMALGGADLSYDFVTRPAYHHALVTGDVAFLRLMLHEMHRLQVDPAYLIHALQNHDELTLELVHFWTLHRDDPYVLHGIEITGSELRDHIRKVMYGRLSGDAAPYNLRFVTNGVACTTASVIAAALGLRDLSDLTPDQVEQIRRAHLLLCMYNAWQPGIFALSGWDLVGALPLSASLVEDRMADGDTRWINRGGYDLMGVNPATTISAAGLPCATALYGSLPDQLAQPDSFARRLQRLLAVRESIRLYAARQVAIAETISPGLLVMVHELADEQGIQVTALNFGQEMVDEIVPLEEIAEAGTVVNLMTEESEGDLAVTGGLQVRLEGHTGKAYLISS